MNMKTRKMTFKLWVLMVVSLIVVALPTLAQDDAQEDTSLHPPITLLDSDGNMVLETDQPIDAMTTCNTCHDTEFIATHSVHSDAGMSTIGKVETSREWQDGIGWYGGWNPITYGDVDPSVEAWIKEASWRYSGGVVTDDVELNMNCFVCHTEKPANDERVFQQTNGLLEWAETATLANTSIVTSIDDSWTYNKYVFDADGTITADVLTLGAPTNTNCASCHGVVHTDTEFPLDPATFDTQQWTTLTTGQVFSHERINVSGLNIEDKAALTRAWDVHAERVVACTDCHYSLNNPVYYVEPEATRPDHLKFDPRRMSFEDYLSRPLHQFANGGQDYQETFPEFERANRDCATCHDAESTHTWLAYPERHMQALTCETCHIPKVFAPALESVDWTVIHPDGTANLSYRGLDETNNVSLFTGYQPIVLSDENNQLAPYNLISAWYWVYGDPVQPVSKAQLLDVYVDGEGYAEDILEVFDINGDGDLNSDELLLSDDTKITLIHDKLVALGLDDPRIVGEVEAYALHHNVTHGKWATNTCETCHNPDSLINMPMILANNPPTGIQPILLGENLVGDINVLDDGQMVFKPTVDTPPTELYVLGHDRVEWVDTLGVLIFLATLVFVVLHGGLRMIASRRMPTPQDPELREVYMYSIYERQWHWLQSVVIFGLIFTGMIIHRPNMFAMFSFNGVVFFHNAFALILVVNAALAAFYHLVSGELRQFLPEPHGFFGKMFAQVKYYAWGIFRGQPHPFEKTLDSKLNPVQQVTYFGLLNVLLPLQVITGILMWGAQHIPEFMAVIGGLSLLAPVHTMASWLMATFIVVHVYMTTTGHTPMANIRAMIMGWDEVETHNHEV
jgi:thiosulfate reductase cytochrome b subunit